MITILTLYLVLVFLQLTLTNNITIGDSVLENIPYVRNVIPSCLYIRIISRFRLFCLLLDIPYSIFYVHMYIGF